MKANIGPADKTIRIAIALLLAVLQFTNVIEGTAGIIALAIAAVLIFNAAFSFCLVYKIFGINTNKKLHA